MTTPPVPSTERSNGKPSRLAPLTCIVFGIAPLSSSFAGFVLSDRAAVVAIAAPTLLLAMAFARIDLFQEIKGAGVELKLRQAEEVTREAKATISELRLAANTMTRIYDAALAQVAGSAGLPMPRPRRVSCGGLSSEMRR
ncbi:hypothetical protein [Sorangium sp. So ce362]|uniref:hypothetical protein n=1 Tax=Sorangium sp. So ce362 TaxID=3133303 RepID=UPI003F647368